MRSGKIVIGTMVIMLLAFCPLPVATKASAAGCGKWEGIPTITLRLPGKEAAPADSVETCAFEQNVTITFGDVEKFHGHVCPGIALGYRAVQAALGHLYPGEIPPRGDQFVVCGIPRACPADAISYITGARYGNGSEGIFNGNLAFD